MQLTWAITNDSLSQRKNCIVIKFNSEPVSKIKHYLHELQIARWWIKFSGCNDYNDGS